MPRRMVDTSILEDKDFRSLSDKGRLLWFGLILNADDYGRGYADCQSLKNKNFPHNHISLKKIDKIRTEVKKKMENIKFYHSKGEELYQLLRWKDYQNIRPDRIKPSKIPPPNVRHLADKMRTNVGTDKYSIDKFRIGENPVNKFFKNANDVIKEKLNPK